MSRIITIPLWLSLLCLFPRLTMAQTLEYWFDDHYDLRNTTSIAASDAEQELNLDLRDNTKFPMGFHKLNMRVTIAGKPSAVTSSAVLKLAAGKISQLEYWVDDDIANSKITNSKTISGKASNDGGSTYQFFDDLDLTDVTPGYHRLYYRAVSNSKRTTSAISMTPIMVKSMYNNSTNLTVTEYSIAVDDKEPKTMPVINQKEVVNIPYTFDARNLSLGEHIFKASFTNSAGASTTIEEPFTVIPQENPSIDLIAWDDEGFLTMEFNTIPNDVSYTLMEKWNDGENVSEKIVWKRVASFHPDVVKAIPDTWYTGNTSYYVKATYLDYFGNEKEVISNEVTPLTWVSPERTYGCIVGQVKFNDQGQNALLSPHKKIYVNFTDGNTYQKRELINSNGTFCHDYIPFGTTMTLSIEDDDYYHYESITVDVDESTRNKMNVIHATAHDDVAVNVSNEKCDMIVTRWERWGGRTFEFTVKNVTDYMWSGILEIIALKKDGSNDEVTFSSKKLYYHVGSAYIKNLNSNRSQDVTITLENFPILKEDEEYIFYYVTQRDYMSTTKQYKQIVFEDKNRFQNPMTVLMYPDPETDGTPYEDMDEFITEVLKVMKECDTWNGPFSKAVLSIPDKIVKTEWKKKENAFLYTLPAIIQSFIKDIRDVYEDASKLTKPIRDFYDEIKDVYEVGFNEDVSPFDKFLKVSKKIFKAYGKYTNDPFAKLYSLYMDVAERAVDKIMEYQEYLIMSQLDDIFINNEITFKIRVAWTKYLGQRQFFNAKRVAESIDHVEINMETVKGVRIVATYQPKEYDDYDENDEVILIRQNINQPNQVGGEGVKRFWMKVFWENGRVSLVPLYEDFTDWDKSGQSVRNITVTFRNKLNYEIGSKIYYDY